jgi:hypothetical protein
MGQSHRFQHPSPPCCHSSPYSWPGTRNCLRRHSATARETADAGHGGFLSRRTTYGTRNSGTKPRRIDSALAGPRVRPTTRSDRQNPDLLTAETTSACRSIFALVEKLPIAPEANATSPTAHRPWRWNRLRYSVCCHHNPVDFQQSLRKGALKLG